MEAPRAQDRADAGSSPGTEAVPSGAGAAGTATAIPRRQRMRRLLAGLAAYLALRALCAGIWALGTTLTFAACSLFHAVDATTPPNLVLTAFVGVFVVWLVPSIMVYRRLRDWPLRVASGHRDLIMQDNDPGWRGRGNGNGTTSPPAPPA